MIMIHKNLIAKGLQGEVFTLHDGYASYLRERLQTDASFVVKRVPFLKSTLKELIVYKHLSKHVLSHVISLVHWIAIGKHTLVDSFDPHPNLNQPLNFLYMTFPMMDGDIEDLSQFTFNQRIDMALQLINMIQSIHALGICHNDFDLHNIMYMRSGVNVHLYLIDFGLAEFIRDPTMIRDDYESLARNISYLIWDQDMDSHTCLKDQTLCNLLYDIEKATMPVDFHELIQYITNENE